MKKIHTITDKKEITDLFQQMHRLNVNADESQQKPPVTSIFDSPNAQFYTILQPSSGENIDLTPYQDSIPESWYPDGQVTIPAELTSSIEFNVLDEFSENEEKPVSDEDNEVLELALTVEETRALGNNSTGKLAKAEEHFNKSTAIMENNDIEVTNAINNINKNIVKTTEEVKDLVAAAERSWVVNIAENIQQLTSMATSLGNACVTVVTGTTKFAIFVWHNWTGIALALVIICAGVAVTPYMIRTLARMLKYALTSSFTSNSTGNVLQVPESFMRKLDEITNRSNRTSGWIAAGVGLGGGLTYVMKIFRK